MQVKVLSVLGMAMNILSSLGQMCRWLGEVAKPEVADAEPLPELYLLASSAGGMLNSHHSMSM